ncbi:MAG: hypothetical protein L6R41_003969 [Letrouitia leprolyta]|nr:MAG: hypothetical protein L6R41_003969 [Letrouitia leprolyta]
MKQTRGIISITDIAQQGHSQTFSVLYAGTVGRKLGKRTPSRALDSCAAGETFVESHCREEVSPQAYVIKCTDGVDNSWYFRRCTPTEVCIQGVPEPNPPLPFGQWNPPSKKAYCAGMDNFVKIAQDVVSHKTVPGQIGLKFSAPTGKTMALEAVLTGQNMNESMFAASLRMSAQTSDPSYNVQTWRSQVGGTATCTDCARILIAPVPARTQRVIVDVVLKAGAAGGLLFLPSVAI